ncbi:hypothetical protein ABGB07_15880 [Micromonosporaceae bacterium B7E4]
MRRLGGILLIFALTGGLAGCGGGDEARLLPVPDTFVAEGTSRLSDPFGDLEIESRELPEDAVLVGAEYEVPVTWSEAFRVPAKTRKLSVTYRSRATVTEDDGRKAAFERRDTRNTGTITLK